jgi:hypothetical protein
MASSLESRLAFIHDLAARCGFGATLAAGDAARGNAPDVDFDAIKNLITLTLSSYISTSGALPPFHRSSPGVA